MNAKGNDMTTNITVHVNGRYRLVVRQDGAKDVAEVHGNYDGSPNPDGKHVFTLAHGAISNKFVFSEYYIPTEAEEQAARVEAGARTQKAKLELNAGKAVGTDAQGNDTATGKPVDVDAHLEGKGQPTDDLKVDFEEKPDPAVKPKPKK